VEGEPPVNAASELSAGSDGTRYRGWTSDG
jgi:hypothetical protein